MEDEVTIRLARLDHAGSLLNLQSDFYAQGKYPWDREVKERAMRELIGDASLGRLLLFEIGEVVGYISITFGFSLEFGGRDAFVDELYVAPHARGRGIGTRALAEAENVCREAGVRALHLEVEFENESARSLYARKGYFAHTRQLMTKIL